MSAPEFTNQDADNLVGLAASAPLPGGLPQARNVEALLQKFVVWYRHVTAPTPSAPPPESP